MHLVSDGNQELAFQDLILYSGGFYILEENVPYTDTGKRLVFKI